VALGRPYGTDIFALSALGGDERRGSPPPFPERDDDMGEHAERRETSGLGT
jgi:hypothetical protein